MFDVEFQVSGGKGEFAAAFLDVFQVEAVCPERCGEEDAGRVAEGAGFGQIQVAGTGAAAEKALAETRALLVGPVDKAEGDGRVAVVLRVDAPEDGQSGEDVQAAVKPAAVGNGIEVPADEQRPRGLAAQGGPEVARGVGVGFDRQGSQLPAEEIARGGPDRGKSHPLRAVFVPSEGA